MTLTNKQTKNGKLPYMAKCGMEYSEAENNMFLDDEAWKSTVSLGSYMVFVVMKV